MKKLFNGKVKKDLVNFNEERQPGNTNYKYHNSIIYLVIQKENNIVSHFYAAKYFGHWYWLRIGIDNSISRYVFWADRDITDLIKQNTKGLFRCWTIEYATLTQLEKNQALMPPITY